MNSDFLCQGFEVIQKGNSTEVSGLCVHSKEAKKGNLFVALKGYEQDGHSFLKEASQKGAEFLLVEETSSLPPDFKGTVLKSKNNREALSLLLNKFYNFPSEKLFTVGVTGTNGKTTIAYLTEHLFKTCGWTTGVIGTIDHHVGEKTWPLSLTTPEPLELFERLMDFQSLNVKALVMEVSSIGLDQKRVDGIQFNLGIFTNLTSDHMDYHKTRENYFKAKASLFLNLMDFQKQNNSLSLINKDDVYGVRLLSQLKSPSKTYGTAPADFSFEIKKQELLSTSFLLKTEFGSGEVKLPLTGLYNVYNAVASIASALSAGFPFSDVIKAVESFKGVPGRLERCTPSEYPFQVFVDYAHTPSALKEVLQALAKFKSHRLITVFGCGGDRDKEKRADMTRFANEFSDEVILTSDNPRNENPEDIIEDCLKAVEDQSHFRVERDRKKAIQKALEMGAKGDIVLIAGKGHESYQLIQGKKLPFKDQEVVRELTQS